MTALNFAFTRMGAVHQKAVVLLEGVNLPEELPVVVSMQPVQNNKSPSSVLPLVKQHRPLDFGLLLHSCIGPLTIIRLIYPLGVLEDVQDTVGGSADQLEGLRVRPLDTLEIQAVQRGHIKWGFVNQREASRPLPINRLTRWCPQTPTGSPPSSRRTTTTYHHIISNLHTHTTT